LEHLAVLASGRGSDFQSILDHLRLGVLKDIEAKLLISNSQGAYAMERAKKADVPVEYIEGVVGKRFQDKEARSRARQAFDIDLLETLKRYGATLVALAGFSQIVTSVVIDEYRTRIMNIHPAYDVKRYGGVGMVGDKVHEAVLANGEEYSGCTVHYVDYTVDLGPAILRQRVPVKSGDTVRSLADRILVWEHRSYPKAIQIHVDSEFERRRNLSEYDLRNDEWESGWSMRQQKYFDYQKEHAVELYGKPLDEIL
jgi:phosphoribosylglycinamide formyltransferase-1